MTISCLPRTEEQLHRIVMALKEAGMSDQYEEQAHGEKILLCVRADTLEERERAQQIIHEAGVFEVNYSEDAAA